MPSRHSTAPASFTSMSSRKISSTVRHPRRCRALDSSRHQARQLSCISAISDAVGSRHPLLRVTLPWLASARFASRYRPLPTTYGCGPRPRLLTPDAAFHLLPPTARELTRPSSDTGSAAAQGTGARDDGLPVARSGWCGLRNDGGGTLYFTPPEIIEVDIQATSADVWAVSALCRTCTCICTGANIWAVIGP